MGGCTGGDDQRIAGVFATVTHQPDRFFGELGGVDVVENHFGVEARGMLFEARHQFGALHAVGIRRPVIDIRGGHQLPALRHAGDQHRVQVGAGGIHGGAVTRGAGAENEKADVTGRHDFESVSGMRGCIDYIGRGCGIIKHPYSTALHCLTTYEPFAGFQRLAAF